MEKFLLFLFQGRNISFRTIGEISTFFREAAHKNPNIFRILTNINLYRDKARILNSKVLTTLYKQNLGKFLETSCFSISADEVTDCSRSHYLAICVHFWKDGHLNNKLWSLIQLGSELKAPFIFKIIEEQILNKYGVNLIGFITDGASVFKGHLKGVQKLIRDKVPGLIGIHCMAHCCDLIAKKSYAKLEIDIDSFLRDIIHYFRNSTVNSAKFKEFQKALDVTPLNILGIVKTRWLELYNSIKRILDLWDVLKQYMKGNNKYTFL